jgi:hypothetical protein
VKFSRDLENENQRIITIERATHYEDIVGWYIK